MHLVYTPRPYSPCIPACPVFDQAVDLGILKEKGVPSSFFLLGERHIDKYPDPVKRMAAEGHELASETLPLEPWTIPRIPPWPNSCSSAPHHSRSTRRGVGSRSGRGTPTPSH
ncbi:polysaccharide deacetylase family protein [Streptomyces brasiliensis]|uniref:NodB homology domain-containing protein n=1 Tax=Streptomyces brasiliensis TaxID=1954 RepID=A0A917KYF0_9ACTN|nr:hypothetical protein GCM10010121_051580 [Streptomyces brasiliensis]